MYCFVYNIIRFTALLPLFEEFSSNSALIKYTTTHFFVFLYTCLNIENNTYNFFHTTPCVSPRHQFKQEGRKPWADIGLG